MNKYEQFEKAASYILIQKKGAGKTLWSVNTAFLIKKIHPSLEIYANLKIKIKDFHFYPYLVFPFTEIENNDFSLLIIDDIANVKLLKGFMKYINSTARKINLYIILTSQYFTMIEKATRMTSEYQVKVKYNKEKDLIMFALTDLDDSIEFYNYHQISNNFNKYDTNFIVSKSTERVIKKEILKISSNLDDIEQNCLNFFGNNTNKYNTYFIELLHRHNIINQSNNIKDVKNLTNLKFSKNKLLDLILQENIEIYKEKKKRIK